jgi:hypothetical protein
MHRGTGSLSLQEQFDLIKEPKRKIELLKARLAELDLRIEVAKNGRNRSFRQQQNDEMQQMMEDLM